MRHGHRHGKRSAMRITVKLFATLSRYLPPGMERNVAEI